MKARLSNFWRYRFLLQNLIQRDIRVKYRRSKLGILWSVLNPLLMMLVMTAVFQFVFRFDIENYPVYLLSGQLLFTFFNESTTSAMGSVLFSSALIKKVYVPKYIFPLEKVCFSFINLCFSMLALLFVMLITGAPIHPTAVFAVFPMAMLYLFSLGVGVFLASAAVYFRDFMHFWSVIIMALSYATPIFYPISILPPWMQSLQVLNPMYWYVSTFRTLILEGGVVTFHQFIACTGFALIALFIGLRTFQKGQDNFILYI